MTGVDRVHAAFAAAAADGRAALVPYLVAGRPSREACVQLVLDAHAAGADLVELGVPFSDPLADGAVIRNATRAALDDGIDVAAVIEIVRTIRARGCDVPIVLMGYVNPLLAYGLTQLCIDAALAGVDGLIVPDVPLEQATELRACAAATGIGLTFLVTPLTAPERLVSLVAASTGFCYAMATTGTTGARSELDSRTIDLLERTRAIAGDIPVAVGFGVSSAEQVEALAPHADGVIVGSALVDLIERDGDAVGQIRQLALATACRAS